ncbi:MAG TPA: LytTR family DNA-binding domain-containing protein [Gemmatimonadaceae bacterium]|nr:LytTR family DNA-binding domain-containing protein [Gemmatimonadaceae bacterium]
MLVPDQSPASLDLPRRTRVVIADDEPLARQRIRSLLDGRDDVEIVGEARDGTEAVDMVLRDRPDVVFLDVKMPELDGFETIAALEAVVESDGGAAKAALPAIIFVTAFGEFAVKAFEVRALDYLLKPFDRVRLDRALANASARRAARNADATASSLDPALRDLLAMLHSAGQRNERFLIRNDHRMYFVNASDVEWADAAGNYVRLHVNGRAHLYRDTMKALELRLDSRHFVRIHRSAIVNIDRVTQIEPYLHGEYVVTMRDGTRLTSSRAHSAGLRALLER